MTIEIPDNDAMLLGTLASLGGMAAAAVTPLQWSILRGSALSLRGHLGDRLTDLAKSILGQLAQKDPDCKATYDYAYGRT